MIHLPGLFEEAEKNERKGKGNLLLLSFAFLLATIFFLFFFFPFSLPAMFFVGLKGWEERLIISDRAHIGKSGQGVPETFYLNECCQCENACQMCVSECSAFSRGV